MFRFPIGSLVVASIPIVVAIALALTITLTLSFATLIALALALAIVIAIAIAFALALAIARSTRTSATTLVKVASIDILLVLVELSIPCINPHGMGSYLLKVQITGDCNVSMFIMIGLETKLGHHQEKVFPVVGLIGKAGLHVSVLREGSIQLLNAVGTFMAMIGSNLVIGNGVADLVDESSHRFGEPILGKLHVSELSFKLGSIELLSGATTKVITKLRTDGLGISMFGRIIGLRVLPWDINSLAFSKNLIEDRVHELLLLVKEQLLSP